MSHITNFIQYIIQYTILYKKNKAIFLLYHTKKYFF